MNSPESFIEIEVKGDKIELFERAGSGMTKRLVELLETLGLKLTVVVDSPCG